MAERKTFRAVGGYNVNGKSVELKSAYYTSTDECIQLLSIADQVWGIKGKRALEPSAGSGNFIRASELAGYGMDWVTNELFPEQSNFTPDFQQDFLELSPEEVGPVDVVIGNPPFSGRATVDGKSTSLGMAFVLQALKHCDRVAYVVPPNVLRITYLSLLPKDVEVVAYTETATANYTLGGHGGGADKEVQTSCVLFERTGCEDNGYELITDPIDGLEFVDGYENATHAIQLWGGLNARALDGTWGRMFPWAQEKPVRVTSREVEAVLASGALTQHVAKFTAAAPHSTPAEVIHLLNGILSGWGND